MSTNAGNKGRNDAVQNRPNQADQIKNAAERENYLKQYQANKRK